MLTPRLKVIAQAVLSGLPMADIGTDHGYLPVALVSSGKIPSAIAADVNVKPLEKARGCILKAGLVDRIEIRLGSGLSVLEPGEAATIVMAGMGGYLIRDLLRESEAVAKAAECLILQPMNNGAVLRHFLEDNGYVITDERIASEGSKVYEIIVARAGAMTISNPLDYDIGYLAAERGHPLLKTLIAAKLVKERRILDSTVGKTTAEARKQYQRSTEKIAALTEVKYECEKQ